jgi:hypothetical protein
LRDWRLGRLRRWDIWRMLAEVLTSPRSPRQRGHPSGHHSSRPSQRHLSGDLAARPTALAGAHHVELMRFPERRSAETGETSPGRGRRASRSLDFSARTPERRDPLSTTPERRQSAAEQAAGSGAAPLFIDPRFLVFEYTTGIILRPAQVELVSKLVLGASNDYSMCHQMLMGEGKTTVVAPLLAHLLADGKQLVVHIVPMALQSFSLSVLRACFGSPELRKVSPDVDFHTPTPSVTDCPD